MEKKEILTDLIMDSISQLARPIAEKIAEDLLGNAIDVPNKNPKIVWTGLNQDQRNIIKAFADSNMNISATARKGFMHRNTVVYHLELIKEKTGLDPCKFYDLNKLLMILENGIEEAENE